MFAIDRLRLIDVSLRHISASAMATLLHQTFKRAPLNGASTLELIRLQQRTSTIRWKLLRSQLSCAGIDYIPRQLMRSVRIGAVEKVP